jgi:hypothetical protein
MRVASRAAGRRARRSTGQATGNPCCYAPGWALTSLRPSGTCPFRPEVALPAPLRRRRCGSTGADRLQLLGLARVTLMPASRLLFASARSRAAAGTLATRVLALGRSPCVSERTSSEVPGCGHASCRCTHGSVPASARSLARGYGSFASPRARLRCLGPKTVGGPPAGRSRRRGLGGSPSTRTKARNRAAPWCRTQRRKRRVGGSPAQRPMPVCPIDALRTHTVQ